MGADRVGDPSARSRRGPQRSLGRAPSAVVTLMTNKPGGLFAQETTASHEGFSRIHEVKTVNCPADPRKLQRLYRITPVALR
jgi:hypothetical protein